MREILPGVLHWTTHHEGIGAPVSSYFVERAGVLIDPRVPEGGLEELRDRAAPQQIVLTIGLHARHAQEIAEAFGCPVRAPREVRDRRGEDFDFEPFTDGDEVAPGVTAIGVTALAPDEVVLHLDVEGGALAFGDALMHYGDTLAYVPDNLLGDDPEGVKAGLTEALRGLLTRDFDHLLFAHGDPLVGGGKAALRDFVERQG